MPIEGGSQHYKGGKVEPLELTESQGLGFHLGNVVKYAVRAHYYSTGPFATENSRIEAREKVVEAVDKAIWYLNRFKEISGKDTK